MDELEILTEIRAEYEHFDQDRRDALVSRLRQSIKNNIGVSARIRLQDPGQVERTVTGKARRVVDLRPRA